MTRKTPKSPKISAWDNLQMDWSTPPESVRLKTDEQVSIGWPFGDDLAEVMSSLNDEYFQVYLDKAWSLCQQEAKNRPKGERKRFLALQRRRIDGYVRARRNRK